PVPLQHVDLLQQSADGVGGLSAGLDPLTGALGVDLDLGGGDAGVVGTDLLDEAAVPGIAAVGHDDTIEGGLLGAHAAQSDLNHDSFLQFVYDSCCLSKCLAVDRCIYIFYCRIYLAVYFGKSRCDCSCIPLCTTCSDRST